MENQKWKVTINDGENIIYKTADEMFLCLSNEVFDDNGVNSVCIEKIEMSNAEYENLTEYE